MTIIAYIEFTMKSLLGRLGRFIVVVGILSICLIIVFVLNIGVNLFQQIEESTLNTPRSFTTLEIHLDNPNVQGSQSISTKSFKESDFFTLYKDERVRLINSHIYVLANHINVGEKEVLDQGMLIEIPKEFSDNINILKGRAPEKDGEAVIGMEWLNFPSIQLEPNDVIGKELNVIVPNFFLPDNTNEYSFTIVGIEDRNDIDSNSIRINEGKAREIYNQSRDLAIDDEISRLNAGNIIVQLYNSSDIEDFTKEWGNKGYFLKTNEDTLNIIRDSYKTYQKYIYFFSIGILITIGIIVFLAMNLLVRERYREIGVLKAIGARKKVITFFYILQGIVLAGTSALIGTLVFVLFIYVLRQGWLTALPVELYTTPYGLSKIIIIDIALLLVAAIGSVLPARRAAKLDPVEAISSV